MKNYKKFEIPKKCCINCSNLFIHIEHGEENSYYCDYNNDRPICGSVFLNEIFNFANPAEADKEIEEWLNWRELHEVSKYSVCDNFK